MFTQLYTYFQCAHTWIYIPGTCTHASTHYTESLWSLQDFLILFASEPYQKLFPLNLHKLLIQAFASAPLFHGAFVMPACQGPFQPPGALLWALTTLFCNNRFGACLLWQTVTSMRTSSIQFGHSAWFTSGPEYLVQRLSGSDTQRLKLKALCAENTRICFPSCIHQWPYLPKCPLPARRRGWEMLVRARGKE